MPEQYAKKLASKLIHDHEDRVTVDLPNDGFSDTVADELERLGFEVQRDKFRPDRLTILRRKA